MNGRIVPLNHKLKSGDTVEIITSANQRPNKDWIKFVQTSKARAKIKRWLKESMVEQSQKLGEEMLERMFKRVHVSKSDIDLDEVAPLLGCHDATDLHAAVGRGDISAQSVVAKILPEEAESEESKSIFKKIIDKARGVSKGVRVQGLDNLLINFGKCCQPVPGDRILGFLTQGRGVVVHRSDCKNILRLLENPERRVEVQWDVEPNKHFMVRLQLLGEDRKHFLRDVSDSISQTDTNIVSIEMRAEDAIVHSNIIIEVKNLQHLTRVTSRISKVNGVFSVERVGGTDELIAQEEVY